MKNNKYIEECEKNVEQLDVEANMFSLLYTSCILLSCILGILLLGNWFNPSVNFLIGGVGLMTTILPLVFKTKIEKIQVYRELSSEFANMKQDLSDSKNGRAHLEKLKTLRTKNCSCPVTFITKYRVKRKLKSD
jgi:hypothetical protein